jgi:hypothetical protein
VHICFYFATGGQRGASTGGMPNVPKTIVDGSLNTAPLKTEKKSCEGRHDLITMIDTMTSHIRQTVISINHFDAWCLKIDGVYTLPKAFWKIVEKNIFRFFRHQMSEF